MTTFVVIPTYNEAENLPDITAEIFGLNLTEELNILIVDDASPDGTGQLAQELAEQKYPGRLHLLQREGKLGLGTAYIAGFTEALKNGADFVIQMDADFSHSPAYIPEMLQKIEGYDVVVGSRYVRGGELDERWSWWRWFLSWWANAIWTRGI
ncbi:MAG: glycosyltransferase, partial [Anaerolineae bacterium]|nr:glycosyltransferase [Anaerolineae bacterium]